ncbi:MAG: hypothetical protein AB9834_00795 [Lentimicrobium sp.]
MSEQPIVVDIEQCKAITGNLRGLKFRPEFTLRTFITHPLDKEIRLRMLFFAVAVCHQTRNLKSLKYNLFGWDFIEKVFLGLAINRPDLLDVFYISSSGSDAVGTGLQVAFSDDGMAIHSTLDRIEERAELMKELSDFATDNFEGKFSNLLDETNGRLFNNGHGLYEILEKTGSFSDPLRKKSSFLAKLLYDSGLFKIADREHYIPIMDYHMQRVLLRLGCVKVPDYKLLNSLKNQEPLSSDAEVRNACVEAMNTLIAFSGIEPWRMNDIFWSLGRSCCNETTLCTDKCCAKDPCTFQTIVFVDDHKNCSFESTCKGAEDAETRRLWEPFVETHFY